MIRTEYANHLLEFEIALVAGLRRSEMRHANWTNVAPRAQYSDRSKEQAWRDVPYCTQCVYTDYAGVPQRQGIGKRVRVCEHEEQRTAHRQSSLVKYWMSMQIGIDRRRGRVQAIPVAVGMRAACSNRRLSPEADGERYGGIAMIAFPSCGFSLIPCNTNFPVTSLA